MSFGGRIFEKSYDRFLIIKNDNEVIIKLVTNL